MHFASVGLAQLLALSCFRPMTWGCPYI
jgi:hypothetical protein